jgi:transcriptional regulator GlxA family with amidase domain
MTADGVSLMTSPASELDGVSVDTLIVPGAFEVETMTRDSAAIAWVRERAPSFRRVCSVCVGSFLLAAAGLLRGRRAATHWMHCDRLSLQHPEIAVERDSVYVRDGAVWSSAGVTTGVDLALALIEEDYGRAIAMHVARVLVVYLRRSGGQPQYSALLSAQVESDCDTFDDLDRWIAENLTADLRIEVLAKRVGMSPRHFARVYTKKRGRTPARAVEAIRVDAARNLLEQSAQRLTDIALRCGFGDQERMRAAFTRRVGIAPRAYRRRFAADPQPARA